MRTNASKKRLIALAIAATSLLVLAVVLGITLSSRGDHGAGDSSSSSSSSSSSVSGLGDPRPSSTGNMISGDEKAAGSSSDGPISIPPSDSHGAEPAEQAQEKEKLPFSSPVSCADDEHPVGTGGDSDSSFLCCKLELDYVVDGTCSPCPMGTIPVHRSLTAAYIGETGHTVSNLPEPGNFICCPPGPGAGQACVENGRCSICESSTSSSLEPPIQSNDASEDKVLSPVECRADEHLVANHSESPGHLRRLSSSNTTNYLCCRRGFDYVVNGECAQCPEGTLPASQRSLTAVHDSELVNNVQCCPSDFPYMENGICVNSDGKIQSHDSDDGDDCQPGEHSVVRNPQYHLAGLL
jgi:hypothetical protein